MREKSRFRNQFLLFYLFYEGEKEEGKKKKTRQQKDIIFQTGVGIIDNR
jgi:hypothetical protein